MTSESGGGGAGDGRHRGRFSRHAKTIAIALTGIAALLTAVTGMTTLVCRDPEGDPASAVTTTVADPQDPQDPPASVPIPIPTRSASPSASPSPSPSASPTPPATSTSAAPATPRSTPPPPAAQWDGDVQVGSLGYSLATVPPTPDESGTPDISAAFDGTFFARLGAARWTATAAPSPRACAPLILAQNMTHVTAIPGDVYCIRVAHSAQNPGEQYAAVFVIGEGRDSTDFPYVRIHATVWPDQQ